MTITYTQEEIRQRMLKFLVGAQQVVNEYNVSQGFPWKEHLVLEIGKKYARIVKTDEKGASRSAWAFVDLTNGDILKPASWKTPAKHARGSVLEPDFGVSKVSAYGPAYLRG